MAFYFKKNKKFVPFRRNMKQKAGTASTLTVFIFYCLFIPIYLVILIYAYLFKRIYNLVKYIIKEIRTKIKADA